MSELLQTEELYYFLNALMNLISRQPLYLEPKLQVFLNCKPRIRGRFLEHNLAFVFQEPSAYPWLTVEENLKFGLKIKRLPADEIHERVEEIIKLLGLEQFRHAYPSELSTSTEQRIIIGRAFAMRPDLLLMDEPYGQMDIKLRFYLEDEVLRLWREIGTTVLFITHNIEEAVYLSERVLILSNKPATIKESLQNDLPYPRDISSQDFVEMRKHITDQIKWW